MSSSVPDHTRRFASLVLRPGGLTAKEAVASAEQNLLALRGQGLEQVYAAIDRMEAAGPAFRADPWGDTRVELYGLANSLIGVAGVFGLPEIGEVAYSLCSLLDGADTAGSAAAVQLHLDSLRLLRRGGMDPTQIQLIGAALRQVADHLATLSP